MVRRTTFEAASSSSTRAASSSGGASGGAAASSSSGPSALPAAPKLQEWQLGHSSAGNVVMVVENEVRQHSLYSEGVCCWSTAG